MPTRRIASRVLALIALLPAVAGCQDELPPVQVESELVAYAAADDLEVCAGSAAYAQRWMEGVAAELELDPAVLLPTTYYHVDASVTDEQCPGASSNCARVEDGRVLIFSQALIHRHELAHAVHLSAWPRRRPLLAEGLASVFGDDDSALLLHTFTPAAIDAAIEATSAVEDGSVYPIGFRIVYWILTRHSPEAFEQFWLASSQWSSVAEFRAGFEDHFGEPLDAMLEEVAHQPHCTIAVCNGEPQPWEPDGRWTTRSPRGCEDEQVFGSVGSNYRVGREAIVEITEPGVYELSVSDSPDPGQGVLFLPCEGPCGASLLFAGDGFTTELGPGRYRVTTYQFAPDDEGLEVELRPVN